MNIQIDKDNDSLLTFDTLIITAYSKDSSYKKELFHGKLTDPKQVQGLPLDPRLGQEYKVGIIGYKGGKVGVNKEVTVLGPKDFKSKDLPIRTDTVTVNPLLPELIAPSDTSIREGDSLRIRIGIRNPWKTPATLTFKDAPLGARLDTAGLDSGLSHLVWSPGFDQGRSEPYTVTLLYAASGRQIDQKIHIHVVNVNRPPRLTPLSNHSVKENEPLTFKVEASDPDGDSLLLSASNLPPGAQFTAGTFSWKPQMGQAGNYFIKFKVTDGGAVDSLEPVLTVGNILPPPGRPIVTGKSPTNNKTPTWTWSSSGGGTGTYRYRLDNDDLSAATPIADTSYIPPKELSEGTYTLYVQEKNSDGVWSLSGRLSIVIDVTPPGAPAVSVPAAFTNNPKPTWTWIPGPGNGSGAYRYKLDNADLRTGTTSTASSNFTPATALPEGPHTLYVQEQDSAGNWSAAGTASVTVDLTPPAAPKVSLAQASPTNLPKPLWTWVGGGNAGMGLFRSKLDDSVLTAGAASGAPLSFTPAAALSEGKHILYVQERDSAGNWSATGTASVTVDLTPPGAPVFDATPLSPLNSLKPLWTWKSGGNGGMGAYRCKVDDANLASGATEVGNGQYAPPGNLSEAPHTLYVQERDSAGNWSRSSSKSLVLAVRGIVGNAGFSNVGAGSISLVLSSMGVPYVAFDDDANMHKATVMCLNAGGNTWQNVGNAGFSAGVAHSISLAMNSTGVPFVAFSDMVRGGKATVMRLNTAGGTAWENVGNAGFSAGEAANTSLALSNTGIPYVAFKDMAREGKATLMYLTTAGRTAWENIGNAGFSAGEATYTSLALSNTGIPYVAYSEGTSGGRITVMRLNAAGGTVWQNAGSSGFSAGRTYSISTAVSNTGVFYVAFNDEANGLRATVMRLNAAGTAWEVVGSAGFSTGSAYSISLTLSSKGVPYIAFRDEANGLRATVMRLNAAGTAWEIVGSAGFSPNRASFISLALSSTEVPYVAFLEGLEGKATVMKTSFDP
ncbi:MAG TPA: putative Ig domain-containing protein [Fibrobacteria bacterium]|nr:putative Ig domain-containing protein [Fibrobacteria bacterium]